jgi:hypothetical protein
MTTDSKTSTYRELGGVGWLAIWTLAWVASLALATFSTELFGASHVIGWVLIGLNVVVGIGWIASHARYLRKVDDLQRKVLLEGLALALGVGMVGGLAYAAASKLGLVELDFGLAVFPLLSGVTYVVATVIGNLRYR